MRIAVAAVLLSACVGSGSDSDGQLPSCSYDVSLDGATGMGTQQEVGPVPGGGDGSTVCLHLDATNNSVVAHFSASSEWFSRSTTPFAMSLYGMDGATLRESTEESIPNATLTIEKLDWDSTSLGVVDAILWIHASETDVASKFKLALFNPLEY